MSAEANKKVVLGFFENFTAGKADAALGLMADNATWWVAGKPDKFALAGTKTKAQFTELLKGIGAAMPKGLRLTPKGITAEGDRGRSRPSRMANSPTARCITTCTTSSSRFAMARSRPCASTSTPCTPKKCWWISSLSSREGGVAHPHIIRNPQSPIGITPG
jgi:hypothetical protein